VNIADVGSLSPPRSSQSGLSFLALEGHMMDNCGVFRPDPSPPSAHAANSLLMLRMRPSNLARKVPRFYSLQKD
jgi:hypothetical protein